jgi:hypothetical protein
MSFSERAFPVDCLSHPVSNGILGWHFPHCYVRAETVYGHWLLIFNSVVARDVLSLSLEQFDSGGHPNSHGHPHFLFRLRFVWQRLKAYLNWAGLNHPFAGMLRSAGEQEKR